VKAFDGKVRLAEQIMKARIVNIFERKEK